MEEAQGSKGFQKMSHTHISQFLFNDQKCSWFYVLYSVCIVFLILFVNFCQSQAQSA
jgi:hypothetical protein